MKRFTACLLLAVPFLVSCAHNSKPYKPAAGFEQMEYPRAAVGVYPNDVRADLDKYTNTVVAWAGIIKDTRARDLISGSFESTTTVEHHYFDWEENRTSSGPEYLVSPRGEGVFKFTWESRRTNPEATTADVEKYAAPGKLAIVYGIPKSIDNGVVVLSYRYLRVVDDKHFNLHTFDYGRTGEPYKYTGPQK